jgi:hypothetical protein
MEPLWHYIVCVNMPGYLPEAEPAECDTWRGALDALAEELRHTGEGWGTEAELTRLLTELDRLRYEAPRFLHMELGPYVHTLDRV